jgi:hypothetical protein
MSKRPKPQPQKRAARKLKKLGTWVAAFALISGLVYVVSENSGVPYDDSDIVVVDFSSLTSSAKRTALQAANRARCTCTCGMTLAQCVATDSTCPVRSENIDKIKTMVARASPPAS